MTVQLCAGRVVPSCSIGFALQRPERCQFIGLATCCDLILLHGAKGLPGFSEEFC